VALKILNKATGEIEFLTVIIHGHDVYAPPGWKIEMVAHPDG